jgi:toxin ParE1/3/4
MRINWTPHARSRLRDIAAYIRADNPAASERTVTAIETQVAHLAVHPRMGRIGRSAGTRELVVSETPYIVAYIVGDTGVQILSVQHASQRWPADFALALSATTDGS